MGLKLADMHVLVFGAGAIGTYIGGSLALHGARIMFLERPEQAAQMRERGLRLRLAEGERRIAEAHAVSTLSEALESRPYDLAVLAVKSFDTADIARQLAANAHGLPPLLSLQNGVENEAALAAAVGQQRVIPGSVTTAVARRDLGDIAVEKLRGIAIGGEHPLVPHLVDAFNEAGLNARAYPDAGSMKWSKMLTNLLANATSAILDMTPAEIYALPALYRLEVAQLREALAVMDALDLKATNLPGAPAALLAFAVRWLPPALSRPLVARAVGGGRGEKMPSFHIDLYSGRGKSEVDYLNGAVVRAGSRLKIATPSNRLLNETLMALTSGEQDAYLYRQQPSRLLAEWERYKRQGGSSQ